MDELSKRGEDLKDASGGVTYADPLTAFLYLLMRDELAAGKVEKLVREVVYDSPEDCTFTNGWLAKYANNLAEEIKYANTKRLSQALEGAFSDGDAEEEIEDDYLNMSGASGEELVELGFNGVDLEKLEEQIIREATTGELNDYGLYDSGDEPNDTSGCDNQEQVEEKESVVPSGEDLNDEGE